jgi:hypothetical protein
MAGYHAAARAAKRMVRQEVHPHRPGHDRKSPAHQPVRGCGVRNDGTEIFTQYEGYEEYGIITGRPIVVSDSDSDPFLWSPVTWFSETRIFDQVFTGGEYKPIGQIFKEAENQ